MKISKSSVLEADKLATIYAAELRGKGYTPAQTAAVTTAKVMRCQFQNGVLSHTFIPIGKLAAWVKTFAGDTEFDLTFSAECQSPELATQKTGRVTIAHGGSRATFLFQDLAKTADSLITDCPPIRFDDANGSRLDFQLLKPAGLDNLAANLKSQKAAAALAKLRRTEIQALTLEISLGQITLLAEFIRQKSGGFFNPADQLRNERHPGGWYAALTVSAIDGQTVLHHPTWERWGWLCQIAPEFPAPIHLAGAVDPSTIAYHLSTNAEGACAHAWPAAWGDMLCHKRGEIYLCRVTATGASQSVEIERITVKDGTLPDASSVASAQAWLAINGCNVTLPCGRVRLGGGKCDQVRPGSILRLEALGITTAGKLREPKPSRDWLVQP